MIDKCKIYDPPLALYRQTLDRYPTMIQEYRRFLSVRDALPNWPDWCLCPVSAAYAIATHGKDAIPSLKMSEEIRNIAAAYAWSRGKKVYSFSPDLVKELSDMSLDNLPVDVLLRLPDWCPYISLPNCGDVLGFFAHLEWDIRTHDTELRIVWISQDGSTFLTPLSLGDWDLTTAISKIVAADMENEKIQNAAKHIKPIEDVAAKSAVIIDLAICCLLYLYSASADVQTRPAPESHKRRLPGESVPAVYDVGYRIGRLLRQSSAVSDDTAIAGHTGQAKAPHLRRAHWHHYWTGPMEGERKLTLKWIPPIAINMDFDKESDVPTIYPVK